ncbi:MAG TPA: hypothetical protein VIK55_18800 [Paludibacter sp.]
MKNIFTSLFGKPSIENQTKSNLGQIPLYSSKHPAHIEIQEIEELIDKTIEIKIVGDSPLYSSNSDSYLDIVNLFDQAVAKAPEDPDLLYARASLHYFHMQGKDGQVDRNRVLELSPTHFDASMSKEYFKSWDSLLKLPGWNETKTTLPDFIAKHVQLGHLAQLVRDHLRGAIAIVVQENPNIGLDGCSKIRWDLKWVNTPHGKVAAHYLFLNNGKFQEMFIPHLAEDEPTINGNYWLLKRLAAEKYCFIVIVRGTKVIWNERYFFPSELLKTLKQLEKDLKTDGAISSMTKFQTATQWYMNNSDVSTLKF